MTGKLVNPLATSNEQSTATIDLTVESTSTTLPPRSTREVPLEPVSAQDAAGTEFVAEPTVEVTNHGQLDVYGKQNAIVMPKGTGKPHVNRYISSLRRGAPDSSPAEETENLFIYNTE